MSLCLGVVRKGEYVCWMGDIVWKVLGRANCLTIDCSCNEM